MNKTEYATVSVEYLDELSHEAEYLERELSYVSGFISYMNLECEYQYFRKNAHKEQYDDVPLEHYELNLTI